MCRTITMRPGQCDTDRILSVGNNLNLSPWERFVFLFYTSWLWMKISKSKPFRNIDFTFVMWKGSDCIWCWQLWSLSMRLSPSAPPTSGQADKTWVPPALAQVENSNHAIPCPHLCMGTLTPALPPKHHKALEQLPLPALSSQFLGPVWEPALISPKILSCE